MAVSEARKRVAELLKRLEDATPAQLASKLETTEVAVRQHLAGLESDGLAARERRAPAGRGRPSERWSLTERGQKLFPDSHAELTVGLIAAIRAAHGEAGLDAVLEQRGAEQVRAYRAAMPAGASLPKRLASLADARSAEGYMAEVRKQERGVYLLVEHHCPICEAAKACSGLCKNELSVFQKSLGPDVSIERVRHLLTEGERCVYRVSKGESEAKPAGGVSGGVARRGCGRSSD